MIKQLDFTQDFSSVKFMDTSTSISLLLTADGAPFDLSACQAVAVQIANADGYITTRDVDLSSIDDPASGEIEMPVDGELMTILTPDDYNIEVWTIIKPISVTTTSRTATLSIIDGQIEPHTAIFPSNGVLGFTIKENLMNQDGDVIATISMDEYEQRFSQLETNLTDKVATLQGPKGDTGDTGPMPDMTKYATSADVVSASKTDNDYTDEQFDKSVKDGDQIGGRNYLAYESWTAAKQYGYYHVMNGQLVVSSKVPDTDIYSLMIPVPAGYKTSVFTRFEKVAAGGSNVIFYDSNKKYIKGFQISQDIGVTRITLPDNSAYFTINSPSASEKAKFEFGSLSTDWTPAPEDLTQGVALTSDTDLYMLLDGEKSYCVNSNALAATMINCPTTSAFSLTAHTISAGSGNGNKNWKITALSLRDLTGKQWHAVIATDGSGNQQIDAPWTLVPTDDTKLIHVKDAANYQKSKITEDDGTAEYMWQDSKADFLQLIKSLPTGAHTFFATGNMTNNPVGAGHASIGMINVATLSKSGSGYMSDIYDGSAWSISIQAGVPSFKKLVSDDDPTIVTQNDLTTAINTVKAYVDNKATTS